MSAKKFGLMAKMQAFGSLLALISAVIGLAGYYFLDHVTEPYKHITKTTAPNMSAIDDIISFSRFGRVNARSLLVPGITESEKAELFKNMRTATDRVAKAEAAYEGHKREDAEETALWKDVRAHVEVEQALFLAILKEHDAKTLTNERIRDLAFTQDFEADANLRPLFKSVLEYHDKKFQTLTAEANEKFAVGDRALIGMIVLAVLSSFLLAYFMAKNLSRTFIRISDDLFESANEVQAASGQISMASQQLSTGASEAASSLEETVASLEELSSMVKLNAEHARSAAELSEKSQKSAADGEAELKRLVAAVEEIAAGSKKIEEIINVIDDIAFQTNLLALNAAVEAARAGEQGKGFAVVAEAVRALAQRSSVAAKDINSLIKESVTKAENGSKIADRSGVVLKEIVESVRKVASLNSEIASGSQEQASGITQISQAMNQLDQATQSNAASAEEVAATSEQMAAQATSLHSLVADLKGLVNGGAQSEHAHSASPQTTGSRVIEADFRKTSFKSPAKVAAPSKTSSRAEQMIPFDQPSRKDGSFDGF